MKQTKQGCKMNDKNIDYNNVCQLPLKDAGALFTFYTLSASVEVIKQEDQDFNTCAEAEKCFSTENN